MPTPFPHPHASLILSGLHDFAILIAKSSNEAFK